MAKEPADRYASAAAFADDLRRWLAGEPVLTRPESSIAALWRKCRRKPFLFGLATALILAVVVGFAGVAWALGRSKAQRRRAEANLDLAQTQRQRAVRALVQVNQALTMLASLTDERLVGRASPSRETLWNILLQHFETFAEQVRDDPAFLPELSQSSVQIAVLHDFSGSLERAIPAWEQALGHCEKLLEREVENLDYEANTVYCALNLAERLRHRGRKEEN